MNPPITVLPQALQHDAVHWKPGYPDGYPERVSFASSRYISNGYAEVVAQFVQGSDYRMELITLTTKEEHNFLLFVNHPIICIVFLLEGSLHEPVFGNSRFMTSTCRMLYLPPGRHPLHLTENSYRLFYLVPPASHMEGLAAEHPLINDLMTHLNNNRDNSLMAGDFYFPYKIEKAVQSMESRRLTGAALDMALRQHIPKILGLFHQQLLEAHKIPAGLSTEQKLHLVRDYILRNLHDHHLGGASELAALFHISPITLTRGFKKLFNQTVPEFIKDQRLESAYLLLSHSSKAVSETAELCGFADTANFIREFKKRFGMSPGQIKAGRKK